MAEFKLVIGTKDGRCVQKEVKETDADIFLNKKIGDKVSGDACGLAGYEFEITGGSDHCGFPMRRDISGLGRKRILAVSGIGLLNKKKKRGRDQKGKRTMKGMRRRKTVCGNAIHTNIAQINLKVLKEGKAPLAGKEAKKEEVPAEGKKKAEAPKEEKKEKPKKETPKKEEKKAEPKKEEKPAEKPKPEAKPEPKKEAPKEEKPADKKE